VQGVEGEQEDQAMENTYASDLSENANEDIAGNDPGHPLAGVGRQERLEVRKVPKFSKIVPRICVAQILEQPVRIDQPEHGRDDQNDEVMPIRR
jgi:hypothetical protein